jgi:hypothetical protein
VSSSSKLKLWLKIKGFCPTFICKFKRRTNWSYKAAASVCNSKDITFCIYVGHMCDFERQQQKEMEIMELQAANFMLLILH